MQNIREVNAYLAMQISSSKNNSLSTCSLLGKVDKLPQELKTSTEHLCFFCSVYKQRFHVIEKLWTEHSFK